MSFSTILFTEKGRALQAKALAGATLQFTKLAMGSGSLGGQSPITLTTLIEPKIVLPISEISRDTNHVTLKGNFENSDIGIGFYWREMGVYAQDPDIGEVLYCYGNAGILAEYIPPQTSEIIEKVVSISVIVGAAASVSAVINESLIFASKKDLEQVYQSAAKLHIAENLPEINERKSNTLYLKITDTVSQGIVNNSIIVSPTMGIKIEK